MFIGIDPGLTGAIAVLVPDVGLQVWDMPVVKTGKRNMPDFAQLVESLRPYSGAVLCTMELVGPMPRDGSVQAFKFGCCYGGMQTAVLSLGIPLELVTPATWKREYKLGRDKDHSRLAASRLYPRYAGHWARKKDHGRAEAVLLANRGFQNAQGRDIGKGASVGMPEPGSGVRATG